MHDQTCAFTNCGGAAYLACATRVPSLFEPKQECFPHKDAFFDDHVNNRLYFVI